MATGLTKHYRLGLIVFDLDRHGDQDGVAVWNDMPEVCRFGWTIDEAATKTLVSETPRAGHHIFFSAPPGLPAIPNSAGTFAPGIDIRGESGYVCAAPSTGYQFIGSCEYVAEIPDFLLGMLLWPAWEKRWQHRPVSIPKNEEERLAAYVAAALAGVVDDMRNTREGERNPALRAGVVKVVGIHKGFGGDLDEMLDQLRSAALDSGLPGYEVDCSIPRLRRWAVDNARPRLLPPRTIDRSAEVEIIEGWRAWAAEEENWARHGGDRSQAVAMTIIEANQADRHHRVTRSYSDLAVRAGLSRSTVKRRVADLAGSMFEIEPGVGTMASVFTLLPPPRDPDPATSQCIGRETELPTCPSQPSLREASSEVSNANPRAAVTPEAEERPSLPWGHDAFTSEGAGHLARRLILLMESAEEPMSVSIMAKRLGVTWSPVNDRIRLLESGGAVERVGRHAWLLIMSPLDAADRLATVTGAVGTGVQRLGRYALERAERRHQQANWAAEQKEQEPRPEEPPDRFETEP